MSLFFELVSRIAQGRPLGADIDYIDTLTLVNQGDNIRKVTYSMTHNGVILAFIRKADGSVDDASYPLSYCVKIIGSSYGDAIDDCFNYTVIVPAHSVVRFAVDYNLCANSSGSIRHSVTLE